VVNATRAGDPAAQDEIAVTRAFRMREKMRSGGLGVAEIETGIPGF